MRRVIGFGNLLQGDDGFGIEVLRALGQQPLPDDVALVDAGLLGPAALVFFEGCDEAIVIDALELREGVGTVHELALEDTRAPEGPLSLHQLDVGSLLQVLPLVFEGRPLPKVRIFGAEIAPPDGQFRLGLSAPLTRAVDEVCARVRARLSGC